MHAWRRWAALPLLLIGRFGLNAADAPRFRLDQKTVPQRYQVELALNPSEDTFTGSIDIDVNVLQPESTIWLNATNITVQQATVNSAAVRAIPGGRDFLGLSMDRPLGPGQARIHIAYTGHISQKSSDGFFLNKEGQDRYIFSQFEPTSARLAFPCFDEPEFKTQWQLTVQVPKDDRVFSNTPVLSETDGREGTKLVRFQETKPLPSYLVAVAVGPLEIVEAGHAGRNHIPVRIITPRGYAGSARYAAGVSAEILTRLEDYFGIPYPYDKLDNVALPMIYGFGAMENAGLITYAQTLILARKAEDSPEFERRYASVAAHEMAHQWFGDLVTLAWWDDVWLNEAFATWMQQKLLAEWKPEWQTRVGDVRGTERAMGEDALVSARKIRQPVLSPNDIANAFDAITYQKGAAVIRMFESWIGREKFRAGVQLYLKKHAFGNATASEFLADVSQAAGRNIAPAFNTFLDQAGVPLLEVSLKCGGAPALEVTQKRYLPLGSAGNPSELWQVPVCMNYGRGPDRGHACALVTQPSQDVPLPAKACPTWVALNPEEGGYYRVYYKGGLLERLLPGEGRHLDEPQRVGMLEDLNALVWGGELPASAVLRAVPEFSKNPDRYVIDGTIDIVDSIGGHLVPPERNPNFERFVRRCYGARARELGWSAGPDEDDNIRLLRPKLVETDARKGDDPPLVAEAKRLATRWLDTRKGLSAELIGPVLDTAAQYGDRAFFDRLHDTARKETNPRERRRLLTAMGDFRDPAIARDALNIILGGEFDARETLSLLRGPLQYPETRGLPFEFVKQHIDELVKILPRGVGGDAAAHLPQVAQEFCSLERRAKVEAFFEQRIGDYSGGPRILAETLESIAVCAAVKKTQEPSAARFLAAY